MKFKTLAGGAVIASLSFSPVSPYLRPAHADGKDVVAGLIVGAIVGSAVASEKGKKKKKSSSKSKTKSSKAKASAPAISAEQKAANIEVQNALNHFGWTVGTADGAIGPKSRTAIKEYQAFMGYPATGELTGQERTVLVTAWHRSEAGGSAISEIVSGSVYGLRGVLIAQDEEMAGDATMASAAPITPGTGAPGTGAPAPGSVAAAAAAAIPALLPEAPAVTAPAAVIVPAAPAPAPAAPAPIVKPAPAAAAPVEAPGATGPGLPTFMDANGARGALSADCNAVAMRTSTNGGYVTAQTMDDPSFALAEQFCLARGQAIAKGQELTAKISGFTPEQIAQQCAGFGPAMKDQVAALSMRPMDEVLAETEGFIQASGMAPAQLSGTAKVCLGVGYAQDDLDVAIGSALLLTAMGEAGYAELLGHHLARGFGAAERPDLAEPWYEAAAEAMGTGGGVFAPGLPGRGDLILYAAYSLNGHGDELAPEAEVQEAALPSFVVAPEPAPVAEAAPLPVAPVSAPAPEVAPEVAPEPAPALAARSPASEAAWAGVEAARVAVALPMMAVAGN